MLSAATSKEVTAGSLLCFCPFEGVSVPVLAGDAEELGHRDAPWHCAAAQHALGSAAARPPSLLLGHWCQPLRLLHSPAPGMGHSAADFASTSHRMCFILLCSLQNFLSWWTWRPVKSRLPPREGERCCSAADKVMAVEV